MSLTLLEDIHNAQRRHFCSDGYSWQVVPNDKANGFVGYLWGGGGGQLARIEHLYRSHVEKQILRMLNEYRTGY